MSRQIRRLSDLPDWFQLDKYKNAARLDVAGWFEQLIVRREILNILDYLQRRADSSCSHDRKISAILEIIRSVPIVDVLSDDILRLNFYRRQLPEIKTKKPLHSFGVRRTTVHDLYTIERHIQKDNRTYARRAFEEAYKFEKDWLKNPVKYGIKEWMSEPVDIHSDRLHTEVCLQVNMRLPEKILVNDFKCLVQTLQRQMREADCSRLAKPNPDLAKWIYFGVLPYLDLRIWEKEADTKIPNRVMADAIYPPGEGGEETVRKTTQKLAYELITLDQLDTLAAIAANEKAERYSQ